MHWNPLPSQVTYYTTLLTLRRLQDSGCDSIPAILTGAVHNNEGLLALASKTVGEIGVMVDGLKEAEKAS
jgi:hypothetical protein